MARSLKGDIGDAVRHFCKGEMPPTLGLVGAWVSGEFQPYALPGEDHVSLIVFDHAAEGLAYIAEHGLEFTCEDVETGTILRLCQDKDCGLMWLGDRP